MQVKHKHIINPKGREKGKGIIYTALMGDGAHCKIIESLSVENGQYTQSNSKLHIYT